MAADETGNGRPRQRFRLSSPHLILTVMLATYTVGLSLFALMRFYTFRTYLDLGIFDQAFSSTLRGQFFYETPDLAIIPSGSFLGTHFDPLVFLLLPLYAVRPGPETLLVLQTPFIALGAIPVYLISKELLRNDNISLCLAGVYLMNPAIQSLNLFDFHLEAFLPFFLGMSYYFLLKRRWKPYFLFLAFSLITIEFASIIIVAMSVASLLSNRERLMNALSGPRNLLAKENLSFSIPLFTILFAFGEFYFSLAMSGIVAGTHASPLTLLAGFVPDFQQWIAAGLGYKMVFWVILCGNLLFLPLRAPTKALLAVPWFFVTIITTNPVYYFVGYQYAGAFVAPYLIIASVHGLHAFGRALNAKRLLISLFTGIILFSLIATPLSPWAQHNVSGIVYEDGLPIPTSHDAVIYEIVRLIPSNASILTQNDLFTHFSSRPNAYLYIPNNNTEVTFILADSTSRMYTLQLFGHESLSQVVPRAESSGLYAEIVIRDGVILLQKVDKIQGPVSNPVRNIEPRDS